MSKSEVLKNCTPLLKQFFGYYVAGANGAFFPETTDTGTPCLNGLRIGAKKESGRGSLTTVLRILI